MKEEVLQLLAGLTAGTLTPEQVAAEVLRLQKSVWASHKADSAVLDLGREERTGIEEVVFAAGKTPDDLVDATRSLFQKRGRVLVTRVREDQWEPLKIAIPAIELFPDARIAIAGPPADPLPVLVGVISAGTSDRPIAEECGRTLQYFGLNPIRYADIGVAGIGRLLDALPAIRELDAVIVIAGMEGALPGVVAGLVRAPVIAVPASVGYGTSWGGITPLFSMLASCSPGITVVNIDNGFGAAVAAVKMVRHLKRL